MKAYQCNHSGLLYPEEYVKEWGRNGFGIGLGPIPVSEALDSQYHMPIVNTSADPKDAMHPFGVTHGRLTLVEVDEQTFNDKKAILHKDDPNYNQRKKIIQAKQIEKSPKLADKLRNQ